MRQRNLFLIVPIAVLISASAGAQQVGTATAVNPLSESTPPSGTAAPLVVGAHVVHNERIRTSPNGSVQLRFTDKSSMSIGPNTELVINEYVYDPNANTGHLLATLTEGALRYVGGELSHAGAASIATTVASIGIRGGTVTIVKDSKGTEVINHFGTITIHNGGGDFTLLRPDFGATVSNWNTPATDLGRIPQSIIAHYIALLTSKNGQNGGVPGFNTANIGHCGLQGHNCSQTGWTTTNRGELDADQILGNATKLGTAGIPTQLPGASGAGTTPNLPR
jgi:FecR protein